MTLIDMLRLRKELDPDAPDAVVIGDESKHYYCDEGTDEDPTPVHRCNQNNESPYFGPSYCPHPDKPCIDGCAFCGTALPVNDHDHMVAEKPTVKGGFLRYECVCKNC